MKRGGSGSLGLLLLANALPIGAVVAALVLRAQGKLDWKPLPRESLAPLVLLGATLLFIVLLGWGVFPPLRDLRQGALARARGPFAFAWRFFAFLLLLDLLGLALLVLGLFLAELFLLARFALAVR